MTSNISSLFQSSPEGMTFRNFNTMISICDEDLNIADFSVLPWIVYSAYLLYQYFKQDIKWSTQGLVTFSALLTICVVLRTLCTPVLVLLVAATCIVFHWDSLPPTTLPVNNKAVLITGESSCLLLVVVLVSHMYCVVFNITSTIFQLV